MKNTIIGIILFVIGLIILIHTGLIVTDICSYSFGLGYDLNLLPMCIGILLMAIGIAIAGVDK
jgi:hypothetical protein